MIEIKRINGKVIYTSEKNTIKEALEEAVVMGIDLKNVNLGSVDLENVSLENVDLENANFYNTNLCGANLCGANLKNANLEEASICNANLCHTFLENVNFKYADLGDSRFYGISGNPIKLKKDQVEDFLLALGFKVE